MAGLRCFRNIPLPQAYEEIALTMGRLLHPHRSQRVRDAGEQRVADRRNELRRDANVGRLLGDEGEAEPTGFLPTTGREGGTDRPARVLAGEAGGGARSLQDSAR